MKKLILILISLFIGLYAFSFWPGSSYHTGMFWKLSESEPDISGLVLKLTFNDPSDTYGESIGWMDEINSNIAKVAFGITTNADYYCQWKPNGGIRNTGCLDINSLEKNDNRNFLYIENLEHTMRGYPATSMTYMIWGYSIFDRTTYDRDITLMSFNEASFMEHATMKIYRSSLGGGDIMAYYCPYPYYEWTNEVPELRMKWHHYATTLEYVAEDELNAGLYRDGILLTNIVASGGYSDYSIYDYLTIITIGAHLPSDAYAWQGYLDDVRIYNRVLTSNEIYSIFLWGN